MASSRNGNARGNGSGSSRTSAIGRAIQTLADHLSDLLAGPGRATPIPVRVPAQGSRQGMRSRPDR